MYLQLASFRLADGVDEATLIEASDRFEEDFVARQDGVERRILVRTDGGGYADLVFFRDRAAADRVATPESDSPASAAFFALMAPTAVDAVGADVLSFEHVKTYESTAQPGAGA